MIQWSTLEITPYSQGDKFDTPSDRIPHLSLLFCSVRSVRRGSSYQIIMKILLQLLVVVDIASSHNTISTKFKRNLPKEKVT